MPAFREAPSVGSDTDRCFAIETLADKGRGVVATSAITKGSLLFATQPDMTTLYSPFGDTTCACCFRREEREKEAAGTRTSEAATAVSSASPPLAFACPHCDQFVLCADCVKTLAAEVERTNTAEKRSGSENVPRADAPSSRGGHQATHAEMLARLRRHPRLRVHALACAWYNELPAAVRAKGLDTDMVRFCLEYGARAYLAAAEADTTVDATAKANEGVSVAGCTCCRSTFTDADDDALRSYAQQCVANVAALDVMADAQSDEVRDFCTAFSRDKIVKTFAAKGPAGRVANAGSDGGAAPPRYPVSAETLRDVLLRTQVNSLGFPFTEEETLGWSLERTVCMLNHSCLPNAAVVPVPSPRRAETDSAEGNGEQESASGATGGGRGWIGIQALQDIAVGEEVTISYVDLIRYGDDVRERTRTLLERYRFLCQCDRCRAQRATAAENRKDTATGKAKLP